MGSRNKQGGGWGGKWRGNEQVEGSEVKRARGRGLEQVRGAEWSKGGRRQQGAWRDRQAGTKVCIVRVQSWCAGGAALGWMLRGGV